MSKVLWKQWGKFRQVYWSIVMKPVFGTGFSGYWSVNENPPHFIHEINTIAYDVSDVNLFPPTLMRFPPKNKDNSVRPILLFANFLSEISCLQVKALIIMISLQSIVSKFHIRDLKQRRRQQQRQKTIGFMNKTTAQHFSVTRFLVHFFGAHYTTTTWNLLMRRFMEDVDILRQIFPSLFEHG